MYVKNNLFRKGNGMKAVVYEGKNYIVGSVKADGKPIGLVAFEESAIWQIPTEYRNATVYALMISAQAEARATVKSRKPSNAALDRAFETLIKEGKSFPTFSELKEAVFSTAAKSVEANKNTLWVYEIQSGKPVLSERIDNAQIENLRKKK